MSTRFGVQVFAAVGERMGSVNFQDHRLLHRFCGPGDKIGTEVNFHHHPLSLRRVHSFDFSRLFQPIFNTVLQSVAWAIVEVIMRTINQAPSDGVPPLEARLPPALLHLKRARSSIGPADPKGWHPSRKEVNKTPVRPDLTP